MSAAAPRISVVVTHYEQPDDLARTLRCLQRQTVAPHEVLVSDDGSTPPPEVPDGVRLLVQDDLGFRAALARNRGAEAATGDVLVFLDADTSPEPDFLLAITAPLLDEPDLLVVGHRRHTATGAFSPGSDDPLEGAVEHALDEPAWLADGWAASDDLRRADDGSFRFVISAVLACGVAWWRRAGGFDPTFEAYGGEDWELAHRWWVAGGGLRHVPSAVAWHHGPDAGAERRTWSRPAGSALDPGTAETVAIARRVNARPSAWRGLLAGPARVLVTHGDLDGRHLLIAVDGLLAGVPHATVLTDADPLLQLGDPRVVRSSAGPPPTATVGVHLHHGVVGEPEAWAALVDPTPGTVRVTLTADDGTPLLEVTDLRRSRRAETGLEPLTRASAPLPPGLTRTGDTSLAAWLGGWWR